MYIFSSGEKQFYKKNLPISEIGKTKLTVKIDCNECRKQRNKGLNKTKQLEKVVFYIENLKNK